MAMRTRAGIIVVALSVFCSVVSCVDLRTANEAFVFGDLERARHDWEILAQRGFPEADYRLGRAIARGEIGGTAFEAERRLLHAYELGLDKAAYELGILYGNERLPLYSLDRSMQWLRRARQLGNLSAARVIALNTLEGRGVEKNVEAALAELERLALLGDVQSSYRLGQAYDAGHDGPPDFAEASKWYAKAAELGHAQAPIELARLQLAGRSVVEDDGNALHILEDAGESGQLRAATILASLYADPAFSEYDLAKAEYWTERANRLRELKAAHVPIMSGPSGSPDWQASMRALTRQAEAGNPAAATALGNLYAERMATDPDARDLAIRWYRAGALGGAVDAQSALGRLLAPTGAGVPADPEAIRWLETAASVGDAAALSELGELHDRGSVPGGSRVDSAAYFLAAARAGEAGSLRRALEVIDSLSSEDTERAYERSKELGL
jgi:TPR repeat protein